MTKKIAVDVECLFCESARILIYLDLVCYLVTFGKCGSRHHTRELFPQLSLFSLQNEEIHAGMFAIADINQFWFRFVCGIMLPPLQNCMSACMFHL